ncbi:MAG: cell wall hydrolase [Syntrophobacter sp.]
MAEKTISQACVDALKAETELVFLALTVWREARGQSEECRRGVAYSILNRVKRPSWWGKDICSVVFKRLQYSSLTYSKDPQLTTWPNSSEDPSWIQCLQVAMEAIAGISENPVPGADSYHDISISAPKWAEPKMFVRQIGRIRFFDVDMDVER